MAKKYPHFFGGQWHDGSGHFDNINPADRNDIIGSFPQATDAEVTQAAQAAHDALAEWKTLPAPSRGEFLAAAADVLERRLDFVADALVREEGKTRPEAMGETKRGITILRYYATEGFHQIGDVLPSASPETLLYTDRQPLGVVTLITPWNFPVAIPLWKAAPALIYGNTVLFKPSELSPMCAHLLAEVFAEANLPNGVFNVVHGSGGPISEALIANGHTKGVSFTGSVAAGKQIAMTAVGAGVKYQLEMGGKNPVIILPDADLDQAVELTVSGAMRSAGEKCTATSRAIVVGKKGDEFTSRVIQRVQSLKIGPPTDSDTYLGPLISETAKEKVLGYIEKAISEGAILECGGKAPDSAECVDGFYVEPTVFTGVTPEMTIAKEEVFGPVLAIIHCDSFEEAVALANDTVYGLSASLFTRDLNSVLTYTSQIEAGLVRVNGETAGVEPQAPFGGMKGSSSYSREQGRVAMDFYTQVKTVYVQKSG